LLNQILHTDKTKLQKSNELDVGVRIGIDVGAGGGTGPPPGAGESCRSRTDLDQYLTFLGLGSVPTAGIGLKRITSNRVRETLEPSPAQVGVETPLAATADAISIAESTKEIAV
jgi:hypothetical protein